MDLAYVEGELEQNRNMYVMVTRVLFIRERWHEKQVPGQKQTESCCDDFT